MTIRPLEATDIPTLKALAEATGFPYPDLDSPDLEAVSVVADHSGHPVMAVGAKRIVELYLWCGRGMAPHEKIAALRLLHESMISELCSKGYNEANVFLPPMIAGKFGKRLEKTFGWVRNWPSWARRF